MPAPGLDGPTVVDAPVFTDDTTRRLDRAPAAPGPDDPTRVEQIDLGPAFRTSTTLPKVCPRCGMRYPLAFNVCPRDRTPLEQAPSADDPLVGALAGIGGPTLLWGCGCVAAPRRESPPIEDARTESDGDGRLEDKPAPERCPWRPVPRKLPAVLTALTMSRLASPRLSARLSPRADPTAP